MACLSLQLPAQQLSAKDKQILENARAKYYSLPAHGFESATCSINFDFTTVPFLPSANSTADRKLYESTAFTIKLNEKMPVVQHVYPAGMSESTQQHLQQETNLLESLVIGLFQTWPSKGYMGPIPPFDSEIDSVVETNAGYVLSLKVPGDPVTVSLDKGYRPTQIVSAGGKLIEHPTYVDSPEGLVLESVQTKDTTRDENGVEVSYDIQNTTVSGLRLPALVHLRVIPNIDVKFALTNCAVEKAMVIQLKK